MHEVEHDSGWSSECRVRVSADWNSLSTAVVASNANAAKICKKSRLEAQSSSFATEDLEYRPRSADAACTNHRQRSSQSTIVSGKIYHDLGPLASRLSVA